MDQDKIAKYWDELVEAVVLFAPKLLMSILALWVGFWIVRRVIKVFEISLTKAKLSLEIRSFALSFTSIILKVAVILFAASFLGFEMTSILGILAAASFAVAFALQGSLANLASGLLIMVFRPYKIGDMVEVNGKFGKVEDIKIFSTILSTPGLKTLIIPNGKISEDTITNFSSKGIIRLELNVPMPYGESFPKVKKVIMDALKSVPLVLDDPQPQIGIETFDSHNILLTVRPYVLPDNYWDGIFEAHRSIKKAFHDNNIQMAYSEGIELGQIGE